MSSPKTQAPLAGTVVRGASLAASGWAGGQVLNLGIYLVLAHIATPQDFGQLTAGAIVVSLGSIFAESGMMAALIQRPDRVEEAANTALIATLAAGVGLSLIALAASPLVGAFFGSHTIAEVAAATSVWVLLRCATTVPDALLQRRFSVLRRVVVEPVGILVFGIVSIVTVAKGMGVWGLVIGNSAQRLTMVIAAWSLVGWRPNPRLASFAMWREMVAFGRHVIAAGLVGRADGLTERAVLGRVVGTAALGQFAYAARIAQKPLGMVINAGSYVLFPAFARLAEYPDRLRRAFLRSLRHVCTFALPIGFVMLPLGMPLAVVVFGGQWRSAGYAAMAMCAYTGFRSIVALCAEAFKAVGEPRLLWHVRIFSAVLGLIALFSLLPFGLVGVAAAVSVSAVGTAAYSIRRIGQVLELRVASLVAEIWPSAAAAAVMALSVFAADRLVLHAAERGTALGLAAVTVEGAMAAGIYLLVLYLLAPQMARELRELIHTMLGGLRRRRRVAPRMDPEVPAATMAE